MKPIFSVHAGEYLVATHIEEKYKDLNVWLPSRDTGVDLLVTDKKTNSKSVSIQVKFSKDYFGSLGHSTSDAVVAKVEAGGWWKFNQQKLDNSEADLWILVLYRFAKRDCDFVIIEPHELLKRYRQLPNRTHDPAGKLRETIHSFVWVTSSKTPSKTPSKRCWETRDLSLHYSRVSDC